MPPALVKTETRGIRWPDREVSGTKNFASEIEIGGSVLNEVVGVSTPFGRGGVKVFNSASHSSIFFGFVFQFRPILSRLRGYSFFRFILS